MAWSTCRWRCILLLSCGWCTGFLPYELLLISIYLLKKKRKKNLQATYMQMPHQQALPLKFPTKNICTPPACQVIKSSVVVAFLQLENEMGSLSRNSVLFRWKHKQVGCHYFHHKRSLQGHQSLSICAWFSGLSKSVSSEMLEFFWTNLLNTEDRRRMPRAVERTIINHLNPSLDLLTPRNFELSVGSGARGSLINLLRWKLMLWVGGGAGALLSSSLRSAGTACSWEQKREDSIKLRFQPYLKYFSRTSV